MAVTNMLGCVDDEHDVQEKMSESEYICFEVGTTGFVNASDARHEKTSYPEELFVF